MHNGDVECECGLYINGLGWEMHNGEWSVNVRIIKTLFIDGIHTG